MCGRTTLTITADDLQRTFGFPAPAGYRPRFNIAPTQNLLALTAKENDIAFAEFRWGLVPFWAADPRIGSRLINARAETVATKSAFRSAFERQRCLIVVDGFFEWQATPGGKRPHRIHRSSGGAFTLAGLWERWGSGPGRIESCTIITCPANDLMRPIHDRMPVIVTPRDRDRWLESETPMDAVKQLLKPYSGDDLSAYEVSTLVNSPANNTAECIEPTPGELVLPLF